MEAGLKRVYYTRPGKRYTEGSGLTIGQAVARQYYNQEPELKR